MSRHIMANDRPGVARDYLGDGVYIVNDGEGFWLTAENGIEATDAIYLEPTVMRALFRFSDRNGVTR